MNILITSHQSTYSPELIKYLKKSSFHVFEGNKKGTNSNLLIVPESHDPLYINKMLKLSIENNIKIIIPMDAKETEQLCTASLLFEEYGIILVVPPAIHNQRIFNQEEMVKYLQKHEINVNDLATIKHTNELISNLLKLGYPSQKIKVQPSYSTDTYRIIDDNAQPKDVLFVNQKYPIISYIQLNRLLAKMPDIELQLSIYADNNVQTFNCYIDSHQMSISPAPDNEEIYNFIQQLNLVLPDGCYEVSVIQNNSEHPIIQSIKWNIQSEFMLPYVMRTLNNL